MNTKEYQIGIYKITNNINGKCYIGKSVNIEKRFYEHKYTNRTNIYLNSAMKKYGIDNFSFDVIELCEKKILSEREIYWINYYNSIYPYGYNLTYGGEGGNTYECKSEEEMMLIKNKIGESLKGENNGFYGKHHTEETKEKLRQANIGKYISDEQKRKISESLIGHYMSDYTKKKISYATKKQWENKNFKQLMSDIPKGNKYAQGNTWNKDRINIYHPETLQHKRIFENELSEYLRQGYLKGISPLDKRHNPDIKHCTETNLVGVCFDKKSNKWVGYINYKGKRYGTKMFVKKQDAINHRNQLENILLQIINNDTDQIDVKKSLKENKIVLYNN